LVNGRGTPVIPGDQGDVIGNAANRVGQVLPIKAASDDFWSRREHGYD
jgi:hypothetical protein